MLFYEEAIELAGARSISYAALSRLLQREIDRTLLTGFIETPSPIDTADESQSSVHEKPDTALLTYVKRQTAQGKSIGDIFHTLAADYAHLFLLGERSIHPYESVYTSNRNLMMQDAYRDALKRYADSGFSSAENPHEVADHISVELEFMAWLAALLQNALTSGEIDTAHDLLSRQRSFHNAHFGWVQKFSADMLDRAQTDFYRAIAGLLDTVVSSDNAFMDTIEEFLSGQEICRNPIICTSRD